MKTIVFDFDGTLTTQNNEVWSSMWEAIDAKDIDEILFNKYARKEIDYLKWCDLIEIEFKKKHFNKSIIDTIANRVTIIDGLEETLKELKKRDYEIYILSGGVLEIIKEKLGNLVNYFTNIYANSFVFDEDGNLNKIVPTPYDDEGKREFIEEYVEKTHKSPKDITFVGNDTNDEFVHLSGCKTICFNPSKKADHNNTKVWHNVIRSNNITSILSYLEEEKR